MNEGIKTILYPVTDLVRAKKMFSQLLEVEPYADMPYYVGYKVGDQDIGLVPDGSSQGITGALSFYHVDDIRKNIQSMLASGASVVQELRDVGSGKLTVSLKDADGNLIGLIQLP